jgi:elongation factor Ts
MITAQQIKELREKTNVSVMVCKKVLEESNGNMEKALEFLQKEGIKTAEKKADRALHAGVIDAYIHNNKQIGVLLELKSESDFVSRNDDFRSLAHEIAMHIAASSPRDVRELLRQPYIKKPEITIKDYIQEHIQKFGENIDIMRFTRYSI